MRPLSSNPHQAPNQVVHSWALRPLGFTDPSFHSRAHDWDRLCGQAGSLGSEDPFELRPTLTSPELVPRTVLTVWPDGSTRRLERPGQELRHPTRGSLSLRPLETFSRRVKQRESFKRGPSNRRR